MSSHLLPAGYETLEPFAEYWAVEGSYNRDQRRGDSTPAQRKAFFETAKGILPRALAELDQKPLNEYSESENRLMNLMLSFAHVALAVEQLGEGEPRHAEFRKVMKITRWPADL